jgi:hypothetical protein
MDPIEAVGRSIDYGTPVKKKKQRNRNTTSFAQQEVDLQKTPFLFFPPGKEILFLGIYFVTLPYIVGLIFIFFYISNGNAALFGNVSTDSNFFLVWIIGYEILAAFILLMIVKSAIMFTIRNNQRTTHRTKRKRYKRY